MTDFRALCAELHAAFNTYAVDEAHHDLLVRARAALAQPEPQGPSDEEWDALKERIWDHYRTASYRGELFFYDRDFDAALDDVRRELARWGNQ